ncbi:MAG: hypothetical protein LBU32_15815 [Clostridiales bacterium]|nr:hypothetical protein [Clostridiales bacterium]
MQAFRSGNAAKALSVRPARRALCGLLRLFAARLALMAILASMADCVDCTRISSLVADNKEWVKDIVRFPSDGKTPDKGAFRYAFVKAGAGFYKKRQKDYFLPQ